jgi:hypothetical protein
MKANLKTAKKIGVVAILILLYWYAKDLDVALMND